MGVRRNKRKRKANSSHKGHNNNETWSDKTDATLLTEADFLAQKQQESWHVIGVMGFAGSWRHTGLSGEELANHKHNMKAALASVLLAEKAWWDDALVVSSGATDAGVLQLTYELCTEHNIRALGVAASQTLNHSIARLDMLIPSGKQFGDESDVFLRTADAFLLLGGGMQSYDEALKAHSMGKPITIIQGFGGTADEFTTHELPDAVFVDAQRPQGW